MERKNVNKILATTVAGVITISSFVAFASPVMNNTGGKQFKQQGQAGMQMRPNQLNQDEMKQEMQAMLTSLVKDGILTQAKADALITFLTTKPTTKPKMGTGKMQGPFARAVESGIITQAECDAINAKMQANTQEKRQADINTKLQTIVDLGKITAEQKASIVTALNDEQTARKAKMDKVKAMTNEQRTAYFKDNVFVSPIDILIEKGVITAQQAAYVKRAIGGERGNKFGMNEKGRGFQGKQAGQGQRGQNRPTPSATPSVIQ